MKITTFDPMILTNDAESAIRDYEEHGFVKTRSPVKATAKGGYLCVHMEHANGHHVDVAYVKELSRDMVYIRMIVDDFEDAYSILTAHGFKNIRGSSAKAATMISPSGYAINLTQL